MVKVEGAEKAPKERAMGGLLKREKARAWPITANDRRWKDLANENMGPQTF